MRIGLVGPSSLLRKTLSAVAELEDVAFVPLEYVLPREAPDLVDRNQNDLDAVFFCGSIPYCICLDSVRRSVPWSYLPLRTTGLLVALVNAREHLRGRVRMSVDTLSESEVREGLEDCSLDIDAIFTHEFDFTHVSVEEIAKFHLALVAEGKVDICLTCVEAVHRSLLGKNLPAFRVTPARQTIRSAVERLILEVRGQSNTLLLSVVGVFRPEAPFEGRRQYEEAMLKLNGSLVEYAKRRGILAIPRDSSSFQTIETMGQFLLGTSDLTDVSFLSGMSAACGFPVVAGFGVGPSLRIAEEYAAKAADVAREKGKTCYLFDGKSARPLGMSREPAMLFSHFDAEIDGLGKRMGLATPTLCRYVQGLMCFDGTFTASEFAKIVGIQPKSSRKVMNMLLEAGLVRECGVLSYAGRGRPQRLYRATEDAFRFHSRTLTGGGGDVEERSRV
ncbi:hypothetical protein [Aminiphilus sp.]|uniref:hypothetical protein n=1 Tax=Aminiphilus sp. TaxID=1872488 RepID=UPI002633BF33|nr:hypothetical protein [Aminiphilus sp.]